MKENVGENMTIYDLLACMTHFSSNTLPVPFLHNVVSVQHCAQTVLRLIQLVVDSFICQITRLFGCKTNTDQWVWACCFFIFALSVAPNHDQTSPLLSCLLFQKRSNITLHA